jgi:16S rRNA (guanine527-N7)-methyltransferase
MDSNRIAELLQPFLRADALPAPVTLSTEQLQQLSTYIDLLLRWNARINLTAVRNAEDIVSRHFGESLFLAAYLFPNASPSGMPREEITLRRHALDLGSGAGFPGLPLKIYAPKLRLTLVEANHKKAAFLAEVIRALRLSDASVFGERLELDLMKDASPGVHVGIQPPSLVIMRAVERFESALEAAAASVRYGSTQFGVGKLALLIGHTQAEQVPKRVRDFSWETPVLVPQSRERILLIGRYPGGQVPRK